MSPLPDHNSDTELADEFGSIIYNQNRHHQGKVYKCSIIYTTG